MLRRLAGASGAGSEPTHMIPPTHDICVPPDQGGACPLYP